MLCEICKKNQATFFYKQTKNGVTVEKNLCTSCAKEQGFSVNTGLFESASFGVDDFFGGLLGSFASGGPKIVSAQKCPVCGMMLGEIVHSGRVGCAQCYSIFRNSLIPTVTKIHGNVAHCGKIPESICTKVEEIKPEPEKTEKEEPKKEMTREEKLMSLKQKLSQAIELQEYEMAAQYRDEIKEIEKEISEGGEKK